MFIQMKKSTTSTILLSFLCVFLADAIISTAFDSYLANHIYDGNLILDFIPNIIASAIAVIVGIVLFFRLRGKISKAPLSILGVVLSAILLLVFISSCVFELYRPTALIFQRVISERWWQVNIPSLVHYPLVNFFGNITASFVKFLCGGEMPGGVLGSFPVYVQNGIRDFILMLCAFGTSYFIYRLRQSFFIRQENQITLEEG